MLVRGDVGGIGGGGGRENLGGCPCCCGACWPAGVLVAAGGMGGVGDVRQEEGAVAGPGRRAAGLW